MAVINKIKIGDTTYDVGVNLANATGTLPVANGGTGLTSLATPTVTWTKGTSVGPTLKIKDSLGQSSSAVAVPSATSGQSGIVTTGAQTFAGQKTFNATPIISDSYYPSFELHPTTINSTTNTYPKGVFEGSTYDNVSMWIWGDKSNSAKSRRGLVLYNYSAQSDPKNALALRQCDTSGNWQTDLYILHSGNFSSFVTPSAIGAAPTSHNHSASHITSGTLPITRGGTGATVDNEAFHKLVFRGSASNANTALKRGLYNHSTNCTNTAQASSYGMIETIIANDIAEGVAIGGTTSGSWVWQWGYSTNLVNPFIRNSINASAFSAWRKVWLEGDSITGAVWNDYAEYRESDCTEYGRVLVENGDDTLSMSTERLQPFAGVSSDTWGFCQGETEKAKTPIAVAGRVLVYPYRDRNEYKPGDVVCAAPNGTVDIMTREEVINYPDRIVGTVSCVPNYEEWGSGDRKPAKVNGRIWIKV